MTKKSKPKKNEQEEIKTKKCLKEINVPANGGTNIVGFCEALTKVDENFQPAFNMHVERFLE